MNADPNPAKAIFLEAVERHTPDQWPAFLDRACARQPELRGQVEALLGAHREVGTANHREPAEGADPGTAATIDLPTATEAPGTAVGPYKLVEQIGEGGMGSVWMAQQTEPVKRLVAVKLIKAGMDTRQVVARFEAERQALALMDHPNIARVLDAGTTGAGRPYFVMDLVKGMPITRYCDEHRLTPRQRLELFLPVCQAVQHAHQKGIIHRDIKPSNVLVALYDGRPVPRVIDFGVAKAAGQPLTDKTLVTGFGALVGTLEYMSPEQAEVNQLDIDTRSDIYSLGVLLYELLTGSPPFSRKELEKAGVLEMLRVIREQEPSKPSTKLSTAEGLPTLAANRGTEPAKLTRLVRGELDWIVMKALEKDRNRRYETANGFAMDVQRYLAGEVVQACPPSAVYRFRKFLRRNKGPVVAAGLVLASLMLGIIGTSIGMWRAEQRRVEADQAKKKAEAAEDRTLAEFRANTDDAIEQLIGSKPELGPQERTYLEKTLKRWQVFADRQGDDERSMAVRGEGHFRVGYVWLKLGRLDEARKGLETARDLWKKLAAQYPDVHEYLHYLAATHHNLGIVLRDLGERGAARKEYEAARDLRKGLVAQYSAVPANQQLLATTHNNLGRLLAELGERDAARMEYEAARELLTKLVARYPDVPAYQQEQGRTHNYQGNLHQDLGERDAARKEYEAARELLTKLAAQHPAVPEYQHELAASHGHLAILLDGLGERDAARKEHEAARDLLTKLAAQYPAVPAYQRELASSHNSRGVLLASLGERDAARKEYEAARELLTKLAAQHGDVPAYQQELAGTHVNLGNLLDDLRERDAARKEYEAARELLTKLAAQHGDVPAYQQDLAKTHICLGVVLIHLRQHDAARKELEAARNIQMKLVAKYADIPAYLHDLAMTHGNLGNLLAELGERHAARKEHEAAVDVQKKLVDQFPAVFDYKILLGGTYCNLGDFDREQGQLAESLHWFEKAIATLEPIHRAEPRAVEASQFLRNSHANRALSLDSLRRHTEALKDWDKAVELSSPAEQPGIRASRAFSKAQAGLVADAVAEVAELTKSSKWTANQWYDFARVYSVASFNIAEKKDEYADRAMELLQQGVKVGYKNVAQLKNSANLNPLRDRDDFKKLIAELEAKSK